MINTQIKFEYKINYGTKVVAFKRSYKANLTLKVQGQGHQFLNSSEIFRRLMNSFIVKAKIPKDQFKTNILQV